jgi:uncharacterized RDD family membrane protein YckC
VLARRAVATSLDWGWGVIASVAANRAGSTWVLAAIVLWVVVDIVALGVAGRTPGKAAVGLKVVRVGKAGPVRPGLAAAAVREILRYGPVVVGVGPVRIPVFALVAGVSVLRSQDHRGWYDRLAGTRVTEAHG